MTAKDIANIIKACKDSNVLTLEFETLKLTFSDVAVSESKKVSNRFIVENDGPPAEQINEQLTLDIDKSLSNELQEFYEGQLALVDFDLYEQKQLEAIDGKV